MPELTYSACPNCKTGVDINPHSTLQDGACRLCYGTGVVGEKCVCGRPARMDKIGYIRLGRYYCGREKCRDIIEGELEPRIKGAKEDEEFLYRQPWGLGGWCC